MISEPAGTIQVMKECVSVGRTNANIISVSEHLTTRKAGNQIAVQPHFIFICFKGICSVSNHQGSDMPFPRVDGRRGPCTRPVVFRSIPCTSIELTLKNVQSESAGGSTLLVNRLFPGSVHIITSKYGDDRAVGMGSTCVNSRCIRNSNNIPRSVEIQRLTTWTFSHTRISTNIAGVIIGRIIAHLTITDIVHEVDVTRSHRGWINRDLGHSITGNESGNHKQCHQKFF